MDVENLSTLIDGIGGNGIAIQAAQLNANIPTYVYRDIPIAFEAIGIVLNVTMVCYFIKSKRYQSPIFTILTSLAVMDASVCLGAVLEILIIPKVIVPNGWLACVLTMFVIVFGVSSSEYHLVFFSCLRLYQAARPLKARASITAGLMMKCCITIVVVSTCGCAVFAADWRPVSTTVNGKDITTCRFIGDSATKDIAILVFITIIPCVSLFLIHVLKYLVYIRSKALVEVQQVRKSPDGRSIAILVILFYISLIPSIAYSVVQGVRIENYNFLQDNLYLVLSQIMYANSIINPLVYVLAMKSIRDDFINLFSVECMKSRRRGL